jgi:oxygen-independent coproporphyrinogen III oxidase
MNGRLGIYLQVPFCQTKCTYCNFHTGVVSTSRFAPYVDAVCREIAAHRGLYGASGVTLPDDLARSSVDTAYVGGGTPSLLDPALLARMLDAIRTHFATELTEITLEADPETIDASKASAWRAAGINRISFGVQSFSDRELVAAGRMHRREDVYRSASILRDAGIDNISFDLIAGLAYQTKQSWQESLDELARLRPEHVSIYLLEIDEGSRLGAEVFRGGTRYSAGELPTEDAMAEFYATACDFLAQAGYHHYEISNWGKPGFESRHNLKYWRREAYLGFGAGAHSFSGAQRWANAHDAATYVGVLAGGRLPIEQLEPVTRDSALEEELFLGLRQLDGINIQRIEQDYGAKIEPRFTRLMDAGLVERDGDVVRLAPAKLSVSNEVFVELMK